MKPTGRFAAGIRLAIERLSRESDDLRREGIAECGLFLMAHVPSFGVGPSPLHEFFWRALRPEKRARLEFVLLWRTLGLRDHVLFSLGSMPTERGALTSWLQLHAQLAAFSAEEVVPSSRVLSAAFRRIESTMLIARQRALRRSP